MAVLKRRRSVVVEANEQVPIATACRLIGMDLPGGGFGGQAMKLHCPFGALWHSDGGLTATMRLYPDDNTAYCFSRCGFFTPVSLVAMAWDMSKRRAAMELLERIGRKPLTVDQMWQQLIAAPQPAPDRTLLSEALKTYCARISADWSQAQFDDTIAATLTRCLGLLDLVVTPEDGLRWLEGCKTVMRRSLTP